MQRTRSSVTVSAVAATAASLLAFAVPAFAVAPTPGDLLIYRTGDGTPAAAASGIATSVSIDEYTPAGAYVRSYNLPSTGASAFTDSSTSTTEGGLSISLDGKWAVFTGFNAPFGSTGNATATPPSVPNITNDSSIPRSIGRLDLTTGATDSDTILGTSYLGSSIRGIAATDGTHFWTAGTSPSANANGGVVYTVGNGAAATTTIVRNANLRGIGIYGGELYGNNSGTTFSKMAPAIGDPGAPGNPLLPSQLGLTNTTLPGVGTQNNINGFVMFDLSSTVAGIDTLYFPSGNAAGPYSILKYTFDGTSWTASGSAPVAPSGAGSLYGITGTQNANGSITFFMTNTGTDGLTPPTPVSSNLYTFTDSTGYAGSLTGSATQIASSPANTTFRGLGIVPGTVLPPHLTGDTDNNGVVDLSDLNNVLNNFGSHTAGNPGDENHDSTVDLTDLNNVLNNFGSHAAASTLSAVPEPASLAVCGLAVTALAARRRRP